MGSIDTNYCDCCGNEIKVGILFKGCGHWICAECIVQRGNRLSHVHKDETLLCPKCGEDTGFIHDELIEEYREIVFK